VSASFLRGEQRRRRREQEAYMQAKLDSCPADPDWERLAPLLDEAIGQLGTVDRSVVVLRFFENKSAREIAVALDVQESAAQKRLNRAVEKLRAYFLKRGLVVSASGLTGSLSVHSNPSAPAHLAASIVAVSVKGTVASSSTLTLMKGALKLMAWTKLKTTMVTGAVIILATITPLVVISHIRHMPPAQTGRLKLPTGNVTPMIAYGYSHNVVILAADGSLWSWGEERLGYPVLGINNTNIHNTVSLRRIGHDTDWVSVAVGEYNSLAIKADGTLWGWGGNFSYQLGDGTKISRLTPVPSIPGNNWEQAAADGGTSYAIKNDGTLWGWGDEPQGSSGLKKSTNAVQVGVSTNWKKVWAANGQAVGLQSDGSLWFWGSMTGNQKDENQYPVPTRISPDTSWTDACFGYFAMFGLKSDGTLWAWGLNANMYTGATDKSLNATPQQVGTESDWESFSSSPGDFYHILRKKDGSLWALDASEHRLIKPDSAYKPVKLTKIDLGKIDADKDIAAFAAGGDNIGVVLTRDGEVWTWGRVLGEYPPEAFHGPNHQQRFPVYKNIDWPWQVSNFDE
jgi:alpha-tubulin suppressor-like RCC1 family protein